MNTIFGYPHPESGDPYLIYAAQQYLLVASQLWVVRVGDQTAVSDEQASIASVEVPAAGSLIEVESETPGPYTFAEDSFFRWKLNGVLSSKTLVVLAGTYTTDELVVELNDQVSDDVEGIEFYATDVDAIAVKTVWAYGPNAEFELVSCQNAIYGGLVINGNITGLGTGMTVATITGTKDKYPDAGYQTPGIFDFTGLSGLNLQLVIDGTDNVQIDNVVQVIDLADLEGQSNTLAEVVTEINSLRESEGGTLPGGWVAEASGNNIKFSTLHHGRDAKLYFKPDSTADLIMGLANTTKLGTSPSGVSGESAVETFGRITGAANDDNDISFTAIADSAGIDGNLTQIVVTNNEREGNFSIEVYNNSVSVESHGNLVKNSSSRYYVETYLEATSDFLRVTDNDDIGAPPASGTYTLSGGTDGIPSDPDLQDALLIGNEVGYTGIYTLSEPEQIDIDLICVPGHSSTSVVTALLDLCQNKRMDCLAIIDPPFGLTVNEIVAWQNGSHSLNTTRFDSDFGALYWPWVKIRDNYNRVDVWVPPSGSVMATIARSDFLGAPWFAPAGMTRGVVPGITDVFDRPTLGERDLMYQNRNCVNPIVSFADVDGFLVWGQKTLQRRPTALDRVNVRRLMFVLEKRIRRAARTLLFDPHDEIFRQRFVSLATSICREIEVGRGIADFIIQADTELNTPDVIDRNEFRARIGIQPIRAAEFIFIEFSIHRTGDFSSFDTEI